MRPPRAEHRLALMEISFPALKRRPPDFLEKVLDTVEAPSSADGRMDVLEAAHHLLGLESHVDDGTGTWIETGYSDN